MIAFQLFGVVGDDTYNFLLVVHILAIIGAFGPTLFFTLLTREAAKRGGEAGVTLARISHALNKRMTFPALIVATVAGISLLLTSSDAYTFDKPWVSASFSIVLLLALISRFMMSPAFSRLGDAIAKGEQGLEELRSAKTTAAISTGVFHLGLLVLVILMVWKPGQLN